MPNPFTAKAKKSANPFAAKARAGNNGSKPANAFTAKAKGSAVAKPAKAAKPVTFWPPEMYDLPEPSSAWERTQRKKEEREYTLSDKHDFVHNGMRYCHVRRCDGGFWRVEVNNGDKVYVFHNRFGSWMADYGSEGRMAEPAGIRADVIAINERFKAEMNRRGLNPLTGKPFPPEEKKPRKNKKDSEPDKSKANAFTAKAKKGTKK